VTVCRSVSSRIVPVARAVLTWLFATPFYALAAAPSAGPSGVDPALAAREVFQDSGFWWKRIEPPRVMSFSWLSWLKSLFAAPWDFFGRMLGGVGGAIARFLKWLLSGFVGSSSGDATAIWLIVGGILAWSAWKLYPVVASWLTFGRPPRIAEAGSTWHPLAEPSDLFEQAGQAFRDGRHSEAVRLALLALIARLEKQGLLRYDTTRTNREYQRELRHMAELATCFGQLARIYDRVWYGRVPAERTDAERAISLCGSLINREDLAPE
jgi:Domain of unknown function (DUF4129)